MIFLKIAFLLLISFFNLSSYAFDQEQLLKFKVIKICRACDLSSANLEKLDFSNAKIINGNLKDANLKGVDLSKASISNGNLEKIDLNKC